MGSKKTESGNFVVEKYAEGYATKTLNFDLTIVDFMPLGQL